jgi:DNA-binding NtrC family response regulator
MKDSFEKAGFDALLDHLTEAGLFLEQAVEILEKGMIERALVRAEGIQSEASKMLGIHRNTLQRKMVAYKIAGKHVRRKPVARARRAAVRRSRKVS